MERYWVANGILASNECGGLVKYDDAQRALDAERARVKELEAELEEYRSIAEQQGASKAVSQLATLRAQLAAAQNEIDTATDQTPARMDGDSLSVALIKLKDAERDITNQMVTLQAQLRQVEGERNTARHRVDELEAREIDVEILQGDLTTLQAQVEGLEQGCFIHHVDKEQAEMKIALLEGTIGMRATERIDLLSQLENTEAQIRQVEVENELLKSGQRYMALEKERDALRQLVEAILLADERGQGLPFKEAMEAAAKAINWNSLPPSPMEDVSHE